MKLGNIFIRSQNLATITPGESLTINITIDKGAVK